MRSFAVLLTLAASTFAYSVTQPTNSTGWTTSGPNTVEWSMVSTDPANFTIVLVNQNVFPTTTQVLDALVVGSDGNITVNPPSGGWKAGAGFQVNLVKDATDLNTILAQSPQFTIKESTSSTFSSLTSAASNTLTVPAASSTAGSTSGSSDGSGDLNPSASDTSTTPTSTNAASPAMGMQASVFAGLALLGALLA